MKIEITPTGEPLTQASLEEALRQIATICREQNVRVVMKPTHVQYLPDGRVRLIERRKK